MGLLQFANTLRRIRAYRGGGRIQGVWRHFSWQVRRNWHRYPYTIAISDLSKLVITGRSAVNGCASLAWILGRYDFDNMAFLQHVLSADVRGLCFWDIGANVGVYSLLASESPLVRVQAFEPHPATAELLAHNLKSNGRANVVVNQCALSDTAGEIQLSDDPGSPVNHLIAAGNDRVATITIQALKGDDVCAACGQSPDIMKIDVEGHEAEVLRGLSRTLPMVKLIFLEENLSALALQQFLPENIFLPYYVDFNKRLLQKTGTSGQDIVFVNQSFRENLMALGYSFDDVTAV